MNNNGFTPCIILPGIGQSKVELLDGANNKIGMVWPLDIDGKKYVDSLKAPFMKTMLFRKDAGLSKAVGKALDDILEPLTTNSDGSMKHNHRIVTYPALSECTPDEKRYIYRMVPLEALAEKIGEDNLYFFAYNSFGRPYETAADLDEFIQKVKRETGSDKVNLVPVSLGGALSTAYFDAYGYKNDIKRVMYFVAAIDGSPIVSDILKRDLLKENLPAALELFTNKKTSEELGKILGLMPKDVTDGLFKTIIDKLLDKAIVGCPSMWSICPSEEYEPLATRYLAVREIKEQTDRYHRAQINFIPMFNKLKEQGTEFFAICGYNMNLLKIAASNTISSDSIVPVYSAGLFTKSAPAGEKLTDGKELSPDGNIDGASGLLPDSTWYFRDQQHDATAYNDTALGIAAKVLSDDSFTDVYSDPDFPKFGVVSYNGKR